MSPLPCVVCGKQLESVGGSGNPEVPNHPYAGTIFYSHGHYGSTVWDPMSGGAGEQFLELNLCDDCLTKAAKQGTVLLGKTHTKKTTTLGPWDPEDS